MTTLDLLERACRAAYDAERWAIESPALARLRRNDALALTAIARRLKEASDAAQA